MGDAFFAGGLDAEADQLVAGGGEAELLRSGAGQHHGAIDLNLDGGLFHALFHGEDVHGHGQLLTGAQHPRQGSDHHQRILHGYGLFLLAIGAVVAGNEHYAHAAHVHRKLQRKHVGALFQGPGGLEQHHGIEAVVFPRLQIHFFVTADGRQRHHLGTEGADHLVVQVPGVHAQGFGFVQLAPGIGRLEASQVQQALVHDGQGIGHGFAVLFGNLNLERLFGMQFVGHLDHGLQVGGGILHLHPLHTPKADGQVVHRGAVRLQQRYLHIDVGSHFRGDGEAPGCIFIRERHPFALQDTVAVFQRNQGLGARSGRDEDSGLFTGLVGRLVHGEGQHGQGFGILSVGAAAVFGPVHGEETAADVAGIHIPGQYQEAAPVGIVHPDGDAGILAAGRERAACDFAHGFTAEEGLQLFAGVVPPPVPAGFEHVVFHFVSLHALAFGIHHGQADGLVLVGLQIIAFRQADAHVGAEGGVAAGVGGKAFISAGLRYGGDDGRHEHAGCIFGLGQFHGHVSLAVSVQPHAIQRLRTVAEFAGGIVELILFEAFEGGSAQATEVQLGLGLALTGGATGEPCGRRVHVQGGAGLQGLVFGTVIGIDFQAVGLYAFHVQNLVEAAAAHFQVRTPETGGIVFARGNVEGEEAVGALAGDLGMERSFRGVHLQGGRMVFREGLALVGHDGGHMQGVTGTPDAAFAIDEGLHALFQDLAAYVEAAGGTFGSAGDLQVRGAAAGLGHHGEGLMLNVERGQTLAVGLSFSDAL